jgi:hypothetical protein
VNGSQIPRAAGGAGLQTDLHGPAASRAPELHGDGLHYETSGFGGGPPAKDIEGELQGVGANAGDFADAKADGVNAGGFRSRGAIQRGVKGGLHDAYFVHGVSPVH